MIVRIDQLEMYNEPVLVFAANTPERKGLAVKTYTLNVPRTANNNKALGNLWGAGVVKPASFAAEYNIRGIKLRGLLLVDNVDERVMAGRFVSGNGYLWALMGQTQLRDIAMADLDVMLNKANVLASEAGEPAVLFDLTDRGAFSSPDAIDISDRFPALQVKELLRRIVTHFGTGVIFDEWRTRLSDKYLLYMGDGKPRGSDDWLQAAGARAAAALITDNRTGYGDEVNAVWAVKLGLDATANAGGYYNDTSKRYEVAQTGTYRISAQISELDLLFAETPPSNPPAISYQGQSNKVNIAVELRRNGAALARRAQTVNLTANGYTTTQPLTVDTFAVEMTAGDYVELYVVVQYSSVMSVGTTSNYVLTARTTEMTVSGSRWYGAGSTVRINEVLPQMTALEMFKTLVEALGLDLYYNDRDNQLTIRSGRDVRPVATLSTLTHKVSVGQAADVLIDQPTDKAAPPPNHYINVGAEDVYTHKVNVARTLVARCPRLIPSGAVRIPVLWTSGDPMDFEQFYAPPAQQTSGALRLVQKLPAATGAYKLTYGGDPSDYEETRTSVMQLVDVNLRDLLLPDLTLSADRWTAVVNVDEAGLADQSLLKRPIMLRDSRAGTDIGLGMILEAEQVRGSWYRLEVQPLVNYEVNTSDTTRAVDDNTPRTGGVGGGVDGGSVDLPSDVWRSSTAGQVSGLPEKTTPATGDSLLLDDSAAANAKKRVTWGNIRSALQTFFNSYYYAGGVTGQIYSTNEKTTLANNDVLLIEDSGASYAKRSSKLTTLRDYLYNFFYGAQAGQFAATPEKTSLADNDRFIIEDSSASNAKKSLKASAFVLWRKLAGVWTASAPAVISTDSVTSSAAFEVYNTSTIAGSAIYAQAAYGYAAMLHSSGFLPVIYARSIPTSTSGIQTVAEFVRRTSGTAQNNIAGEIKFSIHNNVGSDVSPASIIWRLTDATAGSEKGELDFVVNAASRVKISDTNKLEMQSGSDIEFKATGDGVILRAPNGTRYRVTVNNSGQLVITAV